jgi:site-specific recombinase XerD
MSQEIRVTASGEHHQLVGVKSRELEVANKFLSSLDARCLSPRTIRAYAYDLLVLYRWLDESQQKLEELKQPDLLEFVHTQKKAGAHPHSINRRLLVTSLVYRFCTNREIDSAPGTSLPSPYYRGRGRDRFLGLHSLGKPVHKALSVKAPQKIVEPLEAIQVKTFLRTCRRYRDICIVYLMLLCGLRSREVLSLQVTDVVFGDSRLRVSGKGNKERILPLPSVLLSSIRDYLDFERPLNCIDDALFVVLQGKRQGLVMTPAGLRSLFRHRRKGEKISSANPHRFRHTFGTDMARCGVRLPVLRDMMGHASHETTLQYINLSMADIADEYKRAAAQIQERYEEN